MGCQDVWQEARRWQTLIIAVLVPVLAAPLPIFIEGTVSMICMYTGLLKVWLSSLAINTPLFLPLHFPISVCLSLCLSLSLSLSLPPPPPLSLSRPLPPSLFVSLSSSLSATLSFIHFLSVRLPSLTPSIYLLTYPTTYSSYYPFIHN